jgi:hypothetical protein
LEIAVRPNAADLAEGPRQGTLIDAGNAAYISHMSEISHICARDMLEMIHNCRYRWIRRSAVIAPRPGISIAEAPLVRVN